MGRQSLLGDIWTALRMAAIRFDSDGIATVAAAITFYFLLALFPAIAAFVSLYGLFASAESAREHLEYLRGVLPSRGLAVIGQEMVRIAGLQSSKLGLTFAVGLIVSLWSANAGAQALVGGLNTAYEDKERRGYFTVTLLSFGFTTGVLLLALAIFAFATLPIFSHALPVAVGEALDGIRWVALVGLAFGCLVALYHFGPAGDHPAWSGEFPGALAATILWMALSTGYSVYVSDFANYDRTYGPLGTVIGFLMWIWLSLMAVLYGAELNAVMEKPRGTPRA